MLNLADTFYFVQVVDHHGFAAAARRLELPKSTLSYRVGELELALGVRLLQRTSRQIALTKTGADFYAYACELLEKATHVEDAIRNSSDEPGGTVRLTTTPELSDYVLSDILPRFLRLHPQVNIEEEATSRVVDIIAEGFDLAIRGHNTALADSSLIQRHIAKAPWALFAGAEYVRQEGVFGTPDDLANHQALFLSRPAMKGWTLRQADGREKTISLTPRFRTNNMISLKRATCANLGVSALPGYICRREIAEGTLVRVLPSWTVMDASFSAVMPARAGVPAAVRALLDFIAAELPMAFAADLDAIAEVTD